MGVGLWYGRPTSLYKLFISIITARTWKSSRELTDWTLDTYEQILCYWKLCVIFIYVFYYLHTNTEIDNYYYIFLSQLFTIYDTYDIYLFYARQYIFIFLLVSKPTLELCTAVLFFTRYRIIFGSFYQTQLDFGLWENHQPI